MKRWIGLLALPLVLTACGGGGGSGDTAEETGGEPTGDIVVLTNRTDRIDTTFQDYKERFEAEYPDVTVTFEALTDYDGEVKIRMNTDEYGDVLLIPGSVPKNEYPNFFEPLGTPEELSETYSWTDFSTVEDQVYGIATFGNANGFVYNKRVFADAGVDEVPTSPEEFVDAMEAIKAGGEAVPYYTNYKDGWPLTSWQGALGSATCETAAVSTLTEDQSPWEDGKEMGTIDGLLYDVVADGLTEPDPTTTNWEDSKNFLATGQIGTMWLGSWAITQMQQAAEAAGTDPAEIGFMPFPVQSDGAFCAVTGPDFNQAINKNSEHKAAARAWIEWFAQESGFAADEGAIPPVKGDAAPETLADYEELGVEYIELDQADSALQSEIDTASEIGLSAPDYRQKLVDVARGAADGDKASVFDELNQKWAAGISTAGL